MRDRQQHLKNLGKQKRLSLKRQRFNSLTVVKLVEHIKFELHAAMDVFTKENLEAHPRLLHRKLTGGKTLLEIVASGGSGSEAARTLVSILKVEAEQRDVLTKTFADRRRSKNVDLGLPPLNNA
jgi:hypothetical protein